MWGKFKDALDGALDTVLEFVFGNEKGCIRALCMYVVLFLACFACTVDIAYQAVSCFPDEMFWTNVMVAVWFGVLTAMTYVSLLALSECFTRDQERAWRERGYE